MTTVKEKLKFLTNTLWQIKDKEKLKDFLRDFLTSKEISNVIERLEIIKQLSSGKTQREVSKDMWISVTTVNRGARILKGK